MRARDEAELGGFIRDAAPALLTSAWVLTGDPRVAEDLVREALGRLYPRWGEVRQRRPVASAGEELLLAYAARLAARSAATEQLAGVKPVEVAGIPPGQVAGVPLGQVASTVEEPGRRLGDDDRSEPLGPAPDLARALDRLPPRQRAAVVLRHYLDHPDAQSAGLLDVTEDELDSLADDGVASLRTALAEPTSPETPSREEVLARLGRAGADAPAMHLPVEEALTSGRRRVRRARVRVAAGLVAGVVALTAWAGVAGSRDGDEELPLPVTVPTWDTSKTFEARVDSRVGEIADGSTLVVTRRAGDERFTVTDDDGQRAVALEPVPGELPGQTELFRGSSFSVVLTPVPAGLKPRWAMVVWEPRGGSWGALHVTTDDGQGLLVRVIGQDSGPVEPEQVLDVVWVASGTVVAASGDPVPQALLGYGTEAKVFTLPQHDFLGLVRREFSSPTPLGAAETGRWLMFGVGAAGGDPAADEQPRMLLTLLPPDATEAGVRLDDGVGTRRPLETVPVGDHLVAWTIVRNVDPAYDVAGRYPAVSWTGADDETQSLADAAADLVLELAGTTYWFTVSGQTVQVTDGGVASAVPLQPAEGVAHLRTRNRDLAVLVGPQPPGEPVLLTDQPAPAPLIQVADRPAAVGTLGEDGPRLTLVQLPDPRPGTGAHRALVSLGRADDGRSCSLHAPDGADVDEHVLEGAGLRGMLLHLTQERALALCLGELTVGGRVTTRSGETQVTGDTHRVLVRLLAAGAAPPDPEGGWSEVATVQITDDIEVTVHVRPS